MYKSEALEGAILKCKENIKVLEDAIDRERETIKEYRSMIEANDELDRKRKANTVTINADEIRNQ